MPKQANVLSGPPKKRGRKRKYGRRLKVGLGHEAKPIREETANSDLESITAQTATNLKAFRLLFGTDEETEEEFIGYSHKEVMSVRTTCKWRQRKIKDEISTLESDAQAEVTQSESRIQLPSATMPQVISPLTLSPVKFPVEVKLNEVIPNTARSNPPDLKFIGFVDSDRLKDTCHTKSQQLFHCCQELVLEGRDPEQGDELEKDVTKSISSVELHKEVNTVNGKNVISTKSSSKRKLESAMAIRRSKSARKGRKSKSPNNTQLMNLHDFVQTQSKAQITVTPILQSDIRKTKAVKMHV